MADIAAVTAAARCSCFSAHGKQFVTISHDNRVRVWDTTTGALVHTLQEAQHLSAKYTCVAWAASPFLKDKTKGKKTKRPDNDLGIIAIGTGAGLVVVWDLNRAQVAHTMGKDGTAHSSAVNAVTLSADGTKAFSCDDGKKVNEWDVTTGTLVRGLSVSKHGAHSVAVTLDGSLLAVGSSSVRVVQLSDGVKVSRFSGHAVNVTCLNFTPDGKYLMSGGGERVLSVWARGEPSADDNASATLVQPLIVTARPVSSSLFASAAGDGIYHAVAVLESGVVCVWNIDLAAVDGRPQNPDATVYVGAKEKQSTIFASFVQASEAGVSNGSISVAYGSVAKPSFATVAYVNAAGDLATKVQASTTAGASTLVATADKTTKEAASVSKEEAVVGAAQMPLVAVADGTAAGGADVEGEATLQDRVDALVSTLGQDGRGARDQRLGGKKRKFTPPQAATLQTALEQALHTRDDEQLEYCLSVTDPKVIDATIGRLPASQVLPLLTRIIEKFESRPNRGQQLVVWLRAVLVQHTAYLMTVPELVHRLSGLYQTIDARLSVFKKLLKLSGRLDLVLSQLSKRHSSNPGSGPSAPLSVYDEGADAPMNGDDAHHDEAEDDDEEAEHSDDDDQDSGDDDDLGDDDLDDEDDD